MTFKKRNKIILPQVNENSNSEDEDLRMGDLKGRGFRDETIEASEEIDEFDSSEALPLRVDQRTPGTPNRLGSRRSSRTPRHGLVGTKARLSRKSSSSNPRRVIVGNVPSLKEDKNGSDSESDDEYSTLFAKQTTAQVERSLGTEDRSRQGPVNGAKDRILNLDDYEELQRLDSEGEVEDFVTDSGTDYHIQSSLSRMKIRGNKLRQQQQQQRTPKPFLLAEERKYVKMLSQEDKDDILETINRNGGLERKNERELANIADMDAEFADERLALTERERKIQGQMRRQHIVDALESSFIGGSGGDDRGAEVEWEKKVMGKSGKMITNLGTPTASLPVLSKAMDNNDTDPNVYIKMEQTKLRLEKRKKELQLKALKGHVEELISKKRILLERLSHLVA